MTRKLVYALIAAVLAGAAIYAVRPAPVPVETGPVQVVTVQEFVEEEAKVRLADEYVLDMPFGGIVERIVLEEGDRVEAGQVVARVDTFELEQRMAGIRALMEQVDAHIAGVDVQKPKEEDLQSAEVRVREVQDELAAAERRREMVRIQRDEAAREYARVEALAGRGMASDRDLEQARASHETARQEWSAVTFAVEAGRKGLELARLAESRISGSVDDNEYLRAAYHAERDNLAAQLALVQHDLDRAEIVAPVTGPILERYVEDRRVLAPGTPLLKIGDLRTLEIETDLLSEEAVRVAVGNGVKLEGRALDGAEVHGTVTRIFPSAFTKISSLGIEQQRVKTIIAFDGGEHALRPGTRLDVRIITAESTDTRAVPERATFRWEGEWCVFVVENGRARRRPVETGLRNNTWVEILSGLDDDAEVVYEPHNDIEDGGAVTVRTP